MEAAEEPSPQALPSPPIPSAPSSSTTLAVRPVGEVSYPAEHPDSARLVTLLRELSWGTASLPRAPPLVVDDDRLRSVLSSSFESGPVPGWIPGEVRPAMIVEALAPSPS